MYKERIKNLMLAVKDTEYADEDLEFIESRMKAFTDYVSHVSWMETRIQRLRINGVNGEAYRDAVQHLDESRRSKHDVAISAINQLNRMCDAAGLELFYTGVVDNEHRTEIGNVIGDIVKEYFDSRVADPLKQANEDIETDFTKAVNNLPNKEDGMEK